MIRVAKTNDLDKILDIYSNARVFMKNNGNASQWANIWPPKELLIDDINNGNLYVLDDEGIYGVFMLKVGIDETYDKIYDGKWLNDNEYAVVHRIASAGIKSHILDEVVRYIDEVYNIDIRIDTHENNKVMINALNRCGFIKCGIIYTHDQTKRIAFQRCVKEKGTND